jgi:hypothetical protein
MIPIIAISNLINGLISALLAARIYIRRRHITDSGAKHGVTLFLYLYTAMTIMWFLYATPGLLVQNLFAIMVLQSIGDVLVYVTAILGLKIAFVALQRSDIGSILSTYLGAMVVVYIVGRIIYPFPHVQEIIYPYVYWHPHIPLWMQVMTGVVAICGSATFIVVFLMLGMRAKKNMLVYRRSYYLAGGMTCLFAASLIFFVFATGGFILTTGASLFGIIGLVLMLEGIPFHHESDPKIPATPGLIQ